MSHSLSKTKRLDKWHGVERLWKCLIRNNLSMWTIVVVKRLWPHYWLCLKANFGSLKMTVIVKQYTKQCMPIIIESLKNQRQIQEWTLDTLPAHLAKACTGYLNIKKLKLLEYASYSLELSLWDFVLFSHVKWRRKGVSFLMMTILREIGKKMCHNP